MAYTGNTLVIIHGTRHTNQNERSMHNATTHDKKTPWHRKQSGAACCNDSSVIGRVTANMLARSEAFAAIKEMKRERFVVPQADMRVSRGKGV